MRNKIITAFALLLGIAVIIEAQRFIPTLFDADGYLHIRMAEFIREYGLKYDFHWARYSIFAHNFADKDLIYHLLLVPFTFFSNIFFGVKVAAAFFAVLFYLTLFWILRRYCFRALVPFFLIAILCSSAFLTAISRPRPMVVVLILTFLFVHFIIRKNYWALFIISLVYSLIHVSGPYLVVFVILCEAVRYIDERKFEWKLLISIILGVGIGFVVHPNFPNNFQVFYLNAILVPIFALKWGLELGAEFFPVDTREFVLGYPFVLIGLILLLAAATSPAYRVKLATKMWMAIAGFFFIFSFFSRRYSIHSYPLILVALASYLSDWWEGGKRMTLIRNSRAFISVALAGVILTFGLIGFYTYKRFRQEAVSNLVYNKHFEAVADWMNKNIPAGELIFHSNWSDSQYFIGLAPKFDYFVTLDPIYMYYWDPEMYELYRHVAFGTADDPYNALKNTFKVKYGYVGKNYFQGLINRIRPDSRFQILAEDQLGLLFKLK